MVKQGFAPVETNFLTVYVKSMQNNEKEILLAVYKLGFNDELGVNPIHRDELILIAYRLGQIDAFVGDDVRSVDNQSSEDILNKIYGEQN